ncbi:MAG: TolC family protein [Firmicutes bacterium]|nr:TolC family protein [Bacillota bacterium]MCM1400851.1 TolC family protein [Bacteroides sp.]MCM1476647.1 TolC family protein [Bacteroides sp.]
MKIRPVFQILAALCALPLWGASQYNLNHLAKSIAANNPAYNIELENNRSELAQLHSENNLPDPEVEFSHLWGQDGVGNKLGVQISQSFNWPGAYKARSAANQAEIEAKNQLALVKQSELIMQIKQSMIDMVNARMKLDIYNQALQSIDSLSAIVERNVAKKEVSVLDGNKLRIERIAFARKQRDAANAIDQAYLQIVELNGGKPCPEIKEVLTSYPADLHLRSLETYLDDSNQFNPQLSYNRMLAKASEANAKAISLESYPGFNVGLRHELEDNDRFNGFIVSMSIPLFSNKGKKEAAQLTQNALTMQQQQIKDEDASRIRKDYTIAKQLEAEIEQYGTVLNGDENLRLLKKAFDMRHISLLDFMADLIYFTNAKADYCDLIHAYNLKLLSLERYSGLSAE